MTLDTQLSVRLSQEQRDYLQEQLQELRANPSLQHLFRCSEADLIRMLINEARAANRQLIASLSDVGESL